VLAFFGFAYAFCVLGFSFFRFYVADKDHVLSAYTDVEMSHQFFN
jgi:hypothetical protein